MDNTIESLIAAPPWFFREHHRKAIATLYAENSAHLATIEQLKKDINSCDRRRVAGLERAIERLEREIAEVQCEVDKANDRTQLAYLETRKLRETLTHIHNVSRVTNDGDVQTALAECRKWRLTDKQLSEMLGDEEEESSESSTSSETDEEESGPS